VCYWTFSYSFILPIGLLFDVIASLLAFLGEDVGGCLCSIGDQVPYATLPVPIATRLESIARALGSKHEVDEVNITSLFPVPHDLEVAR